MVRIPPTESSRPVPMNLIERACVLDCGDGVCEVAALGRAGSVSGEFRSLERCQSQSGDFVPTRRDHRTPKPGGPSKVHGDERAHGSGRTTGRSQS